MTVETLLWVAFASGKVKTNKSGGANCMQFNSIIEFLLTHGHWLDGMAIWSGRKAMENKPITKMSIWGTALWKFKRCIKVGHAYEEPLSGLENDWNILVCSLEGASGVHKLRTYWEDVTIQRWVKSRPFVNSEAWISMRNILSVNKRDRHCRYLWGSGDKSMGNGRSYT